MGMATFHSLAEAQLFILQLSLGPSMQCVRPLLRKFAATR